MAEAVRARPLLGTRVEIRVSSAADDEREWPLERLHTAADLGFAAVEAVQRLMSLHDPASELSRLNREAAHAAQRVHPYLLEVLEAALRFARMSGGAFDPCVADELERWGYLPATERPPREAGVPAHEGASWRDIELTADGCVRFHRPLRLDLGGIAKGFAVDMAVQALARAGARDILVNAGGDLRAAGPKKRRVLLRHPEQPLRAAHEVELDNRALATSAAYFSRRRIESAQVCPDEVCALVDPATRRPWAGRGSVSVWADDCMTADALTKAVMFAPKPVADAVLERCGSRALLLEPCLNPPG